MFGDGQAVSAGGIGQHRLLRQCAVAEAFRSGVIKLQPFQLLRILQKRRIHISQDDFRVPDDFFCHVFFQAVTEFQMTEIHLQTLFLSLVQRQRNQNLHNHSSSCGIGARYRPFFRVFALYPDFYPFGIPASGL